MNEYQLTGSLYQDLTALRNLYNLYGKYPLTKDTDTNLQIMLNMDINDIASFCQTNKNANQLCQDFYFWTLKFEYDNLPIINPFTSDTHFIKEYHLVKHTNDNARYILSINDIEQRRDKTNGMIRVDDLPIDMLKLLKNQHINTLNTDKIISLAVRRTVNTSFQVLFFNDHGDRRHITRLLDLTANTKFVILLFTILLYNNIPISDNNGLRFIINDQYLDWLKESLRYRYKQDKLLLFKRMGILDALKYQD